MNKKQFIENLESKYDGWEVYVNTSASEIIFINNTWSSETELNLNQIFSFMDDCKVITFDKVLIKTNARYFRREINTTISIVIKHDLKFEE